MHLSWEVCLPEGFEVSPKGEDEVAIQSEYERVCLRKLTPSHQKALQLLNFPGASVNALVSEVWSSTVPGAGARLVALLGELLKKGLLDVTACDAGEELATLMPVNVGLSLAPFEIGPDHLVLSRFAYVCRIGRSAILESPQLPGRIVLHTQEAAALVAALTKPQRFNDLLDRFQQLSNQGLRGFVQLLGSCRVVTNVDRQGNLEEEARTPGLKGWEFHDLLFHAQSRAGRNGEVRSLPSEEQPPMFKQWPEPNKITLFQPDLEALRKTDAPFSQVLEERRSVRDFGPEPITAQQLAEFLYRVARVRWYVDYELETQSGRVPVHTTARPYPVGGSLYELEIYPVVQACDGLDPAVYHYQPEDHTLHRVGSHDDNSETLLWEASQSAGIEQDKIQVLFVVSSRFQRIGWKYSNFSYALILKHVGVLYQTMYLVATAMGLGPCALGNGNSNVFAKVIGSSYYEETSVGEFLLGTIDPNSFVE